MPAQPTSSRQSTVSPLQASRQLLAMPIPKNMLTAHAGEDKVKSMKPPTTDQVIARIRYVLLNMQHRRVQENLARQEGHNAKHTMDQSDYTVLKRALKKSLQDLLKDAGPRSIGPLLLMVKSSGLGWGRVRRKVVAKTLLPEKWLQRLLNAQCAERPDILMGFLHQNDHGAEELAALAVQIYHNAALDKEASRKVGLPMLLRVSGFTMADFAKLDLRKVSAIEALSHARAASRHVKPKSHAWSVVLQELLIFSLPGHTTNLFENIQAMYAFMDNMAPRDRKIIGRYLIKALVRIYQSQWPSEFQNILKTTSFGARHVQGGDHNALDVDQASRSLAQKWLKVVTKNRKGLGLHAMLHLIDGLGVAIDAIPKKLAQHVLWLNQRALLAGTLGVDDLKLLFKLDQKYPNVNLVPALEEIESGLKDVTFIRLMRIYAHCPKKHLSSLKTGLLRLSQLSKENTPLKDHVARTISALYASYQDMTVDQKRHFLSDWPGANNPDAWHSVPVQCYGLSKSTDHHGSFVDVLKDKTKLDEKYIRQVCVASSSASTLPRGQKDQVQIVEGKSKLVASQRHQQQHKAQNHDHASISWRSTHTCLLTVAIAFFSVSSLALGTVDGLMWAQTSMTMHYVLTICTGIAFAITGILIGTYRQQSQMQRIQGEGNACRPDFFGSRDPSPYGHSNLNEGESWDDKQANQPRID